MKRFLYLIVFCFVSVTIHAQMSHSFFGTTLGVSTKKQVVDALISKRINIEANTETSILTGHVVYDGVNYDEMMMTFYKGKLLTVCFSDAEGFSYSKVNQLGEKYTRKYPSYRYYFTNAESGFMLDDDVMTIMIVKEYVIFEDMKLKNQSLNDADVLYRETHPYTEPRPSSNILGCILGASSKQQVISTLKAKGHRVVANNGANNVIFSGKTYEGVSFDFVGALFFQGKLVTMMFMQNDRDLSQYELNTLEKNLRLKYDAYDLERKLGEDTGAINFCDERVFVAIMPELLSFSDSKLLKKQQRSDFRALRGKRL